MKSGTKVALAMVLYAAALAPACKSSRHSKLDGLAGNVRGGDLDDSVSLEAATRSSVSDEESGGTGTRMALDEGKMGKKDEDRADGQYKMRAGEQETARNAGILGSTALTAGAAHAVRVDDGPAADKAPDAKAIPANEKVKEEADRKHGTGKGTGGGIGGQEEAVTRAWFPETFLWNPLVVTDATGHATVPVRVPDRLTTWHVLALAHSRTGAQGGATTSFVGTLPAYVDLVVPAFLVVGDVIRLPVQLVNTTDQPIAAPLAIVAENATLGPSGGNRVIPAGGNLVEYVELTANKAGVVKIKASIGDTDAVIRTFEVKPGGKPEEVHASGTLAAPRQLTLTGPAGADRATDRAKLVVYPGALALLRSELGVSTAREGVADDAYALALAGRAPALLKALGDEPDPDAIRTISLVAGQKVVRDARTLTIDSAMVLGEAALAHAQNPVMQRLGERAIDYLANQQRPDGSFGGGNGWTLQRLLVTTADGTRAVLGSVALASTDAATAQTTKARAERVQTRAAAMFERDLDRVDDGYTAAAILASGAVSGEAAAQLRAKLVAKIATGTDGAKYVTVAAESVSETPVRADGTIPSIAEATALAVLALDTPAATQEDKALVADLGATLLGSYSPVVGWGDGRANLVAMRAVLQLFKDPVPANVAITLTMDGHPIASSTLDRAALRDALTVEAPIATGLAGAHVFAITAEPAVPGLAYALQLQSWVPWPKETVNQGLELSLPLAVAGSVGKPIDLTITAVAPSGTPIHLTEALPAGVQIDTPSVQKLVTDGAISRFAISDGKLELFVNALSPGQTFTAKLRAIPTLAGTLHAGASQIEQAKTAFHVPPTVWTIKP